jgi:ABC-type branched-subunit amino acid transport system ATPase component/ABC-type branched-subunit amino acid transport system permease subunit
MLTNLAETLPAPLVGAWHHRRAGPIIRVALAVVIVPAAINVVFARNPPLGILLNGVVIGSLYGLIAMGLVLIYRANRIVNFSQAGLGAVPAVAALILFTSRGWPYGIAVVITVVGGIGLGAMVDTVIVRRFRRSPRLILTVATIGIAQLLAFLEFFTPRWITGEVLPPTKFETPFTSARVEIGDVYFTGDHLVAVLTVVAAAVGLGAFFRYTRIGVAVRAAAENGDRALLLGIPVNRVTTVVWMIAATMSALGVFLRAPIVGLPLGSLIGPAILLFSLAAAVMARMESLPKALAAGIFIGVLDQAAFYSTRTSEISNALMLPVVLVALLVQRGQLSRALDTGQSTWQTVKEFRPIPHELRRVPEVLAARIGLGVFAVVVALGAPFFVGDLRRNLASLVVIYAMIGVSLVILTGWAGQISLGHFALAGVGAAVAGGLAADAGADFFLALVAAGISGAAIAVAVGLPALRLQGLFLAVTTLAFAANAESFFLNRRYFGWLLPEEQNPVLRPVLLKRFDVSGDLAYYYVCLAGLVMAVLVARSLRRSRSGRVFIGARDNGRAVQAFGVSVPLTRLAAFAISGFIAAVAGALFSYLQGAVDAGVFTPTVSVQVFAMAVIGGLGSIVGGIIGAVYIIGIQYFLPDYQLLASGVGMLLLLLVFPGGLAEVGFQLRDRFLRRVALRRQIHVPSLLADSLVPSDVVPALESAGPSPSEASSHGTLDEDALLRVRGLDVAYDNVQVLFGVDFDVREGEILALLGTNGAGKSTLLRAVSGLVAPRSGTITFEGEDVTGIGAVRLATGGIVQMPGGKGVFPTLTVAENLKAAAWLYHGDSAHVASATADVLERFPVLAERSGEMAGNLSGGEQQMLALGMSFIMKPKLLMIDELSLGLAPATIELLLGIVRAIHDQGTTIVLVEQSINVALTLADRAYFMEKGEVRFSGSTDELLERDDILRAVFLQGASSALGTNGDGAAALDRVGPTTDVVLEVKDLRRAFGAVTAVDGVSFELHANEILGLIGHNGAGKTTIFDLISGFLTPDEGAVSLLGQDITRLSPHRRAWMGLGRSFQDARIFPSLTVAENIALSLERHLDTRDHVAAALHLAAVTDLEEDIAWSVHDLVELMNLGAYRSKLAGDLSTGTRRIVDLAMALAHDPLVLLLDEPSAGIAQREAEALGPVLCRIQAETGCALLVIEHDMPLMQGICDRIIALETGRVIAEGAPAEVVADPRVIESYLGGDLATINRSGRLPGVDGRASGRPAARRAVRARGASA